MLLDAHPGELVDRKHLEAELHQRAVLVSADAQRVDNRGHVFEQERRRVGFLGVVRTSMPRSRRGEGRGADRDEGDRVRVRDRVSRTRRYNVDPGPGAA